MSVSRRDSSSWFNQLTKRGETRDMSATISKIVQRSNMTFSPRSTRVKAHDFKLAKGSEPKCNALPKEEDLKVSSIHTSSPASNVNSEPESISNLETLRRLISSRKANEEKRSNINSTPGLLKENVADIKSPTGDVRRHRVMLEEDSASRPKDYTQEILQWDYFSRPEIEQRLHI